MHGANQRKLEYSKSNMFAITLLIVNGKMLIVNICLKNHHISYQRMYRPELVVYEYLYL